MDALGPRPALAATDLLTARYQLERLNQIAQTDPVAALTGLRELTSAVAALSDRGLEAEVYNRMATLLYITGEPVEGAGNRQRALELARASGDHPALMIALCGVGATPAEVAEAAERADDVGDVFAGYYALNYLGTLVFDEDTETARRYFERALELIKDAGLSGFDYLGFNSLGHALVLLGERDRGRELLGRGFDSAQRHRDNRAVHFSLFSLAECAALSGEYIVAATLLGASDRHGQRTGFVHVGEIADQLAELEVRVREKLGERRFDSARVAGRTMSAEAVVDLAAHRSARTLRLVETS